MPGEPKLREAVTRWCGVGLPLAGLVAATLALWLRFNAPPGAMSGRVLAIARKSDLVNHFVGATERVARRLAAGEVPLWNPEGCSGIPLLAALQSGVFYPGTWLALVLPARAALPLLAFLQCALGGIFALWLFRSWGCGPFAAAACALVFVAKCCLAQVLWPPAAASVVWLPWLLLCVEKLSRAFHPGWWAGLALGCALQILAGFPQYALFTHLVVVPYAALRLLERALAERLPWARIAARAGALAAAASLGVGLAGAQLLPTLELLSESLRSRPLPPSEVHYLDPWGFLHGANLLRTVFDPSPGEIVYELRASGYLGTAALLAALLAPALAWRQPRTWLLLLAGVSALLLADGYRGPGRPLYAAFASLPVAGSLRTPERFLFLAFFCASGLAAIGTAAIEAEHTRAGRLRLAALALGATAAVALAMLADGQGEAAWRAPLAAALLLGLGARTRWLRLAAGPLLLAFAAGDLALATGETGSLRAIPRAFTEIYQNGAARLPPARLDAQRDRVGSDRLELLGFLPIVATGASAGVRRAACYEALVPAQWAELHRKLLGEPARAATLFGVAPERSPAFYDVMSVRRVIRRGAGQGEGGIVAWENEDALPRAFVIRSYRLAARDTALDHVARGDVDFRRVVLLDRAPGFSPDPETGAAQPARIVEDAPERVVVEAEAAADSLLVLTDGHYPGWEARIDGKPAEILLANGLHRAVALPEGRHRIVFEYRPRSFRLGAALSLLSLAALAGTGTVLRWWGFSGTGTVLGWWGFLDSRSGPGGRRRRGENPRIPTV